jgi:hypothetical protein
VTLSLGTFYAPGNFDDSVVNQQLAVFRSSGIASPEFTPCVNATGLVGFDSCFALDFLVLWRIKMANR